ncbi:DUF2993 domain-containing protein [Microbacterium sp. CJ77]|uniref:LmeA family phospholipid-binding protein n=1 Tax=Microbacterium sp. CJ77 TaxID=2079201 RepID=UPI000CD8B7C1|nr:DUF2993 domain-containing protein [Microbacterium sp. CJ77]
MTTPPDVPPTLHWDDAPPPRRKRRLWPWIVSLGVVLVLFGGAAFAGEWLARDLVERGVRSALASELGVPADQAEVQVGGLVIPQLISGRFDEVRIEAQDVSLQGFTGDVEVTARGVPLTADGPLDSAEASVSLDQEQLRTLLSGVEGFPAESLGLSGTDVTMTVQLNVFGVAVPIGVGLTPSAAGGALVLTPASFTLAGATADAQGLRDQFGSVADAALQPWQVCIASSLPAGLTLTDVAVVDHQVVAQFDIASGILVDSTLRDSGVCG